MDRVGVVASHPFAGNKAKGWGTDQLYLTQATDVRPTPDYSVSQERVDVTR